MIDLITQCVGTNDRYEFDGFDEHRIALNSMSRVIPIIMKNELSPKQRLCLQMFLISNKTQRQIANELKLSQPTVCKHINSGKDIVNRYLSYCYYSVGKANEQWLKQI